MHIRFSLRHNFQSRVVLSMTLTLVEIIWILTQVIKIMDLDLETAPRQGNVKCCVKQGMSAISLVGEMAAGWKHLTQEDVTLVWLFLGLISFLLSRLYRKISGCSDPEAVTVNCALLPEVDRGHHHRTSKYKDTPEMRQYFYLYHWWFALCLWS